MKWFRKKRGNDGDDPDSRSKDEAGQNPQDGLYGGGPKYRTLQEEMTGHKRRSSYERRAHSRHSKEKVDRDEQERNVIPLLFLFKWACLAAIVIAGLWTLKSYLASGNMRLSEELQETQAQLERLKKRSAGEAPVFDISRTDQMPFMIKKWKDADAATRSAVNLLRWEGRKEAEQRLRDALEADPGHQEARVMMARMAMQNEEHLRAVDLLVPALNTDPDRRELRLMLASALENAHEFEAARYVAEWITTDEPHNIEALEIAARVRFQLGDLDKALEHYETILKVNSGHIEALNGMANIYYQKEEYKKAIPRYTRLMELQPDEWRHYYRAAVCNAQMEKPVQSVIALELASSNFGDARVIAWLGVDEFNPIRESHLFQGFAQRMVQGSKAGEMASAEEAQKKKKKVIETPKSMKELEFGMKAFEDQLFEETE
ncbi:tetratricopeptide repeat protein [Kiritimatiella glycovorans]|uniref:Tetratricopeptide repeat protein n=1 Tax=Kiritimatiella glycovorans TaxID=1307763 RepID=A0A0G3EFR7_9BACT|nr:tetratricopeptide repeat protein [Kiritimatiella glycovorans]AKJ64252.1 tetratricopeptide repeat protein [Kiritimatiella glycovorans]